MKATESNARSGELDAIRAERERDCGSEPAVGASTRNGEPASFRKPGSLRRASTPQRNFWVDLATAAVLATMVGTGILLKWVLPPCPRGGRGLTWLGETRHFWGDVHFWVATAMVALVAIHLILHWRWITNCWRSLVGTLRSPATWLVLLLGVGLIALPLLVPAERHESKHSGRGPDQDRATDCSESDRGAANPCEQRGRRQRGR